MSKPILAAVLSLVLGIAAPRVFAGTISDPATPDPTANLDPPGNLVVNGSFQTGNFAGWTLVGDPFLTFVASNVDGFNGEDADPFFAAFGQFGSDAQLSQTITDTPGTTYTFSFYYGADGGTPADFSALYDGATLFTTTNTADTRPNYVLESFTVTGTGTDTIQFNARNDPGYYALDNVSLSQAPEPSSAGLALIGFGLLAGSVWRRRRSAL